MVESEEGKRISLESERSGTFLIDSTTGLRLPDPYPEYLACPHCGEPEVEVWCYQRRVRCHNCGEWIDHNPSQDCNIHPFCQGGAPDSQV